MYKMNTEIFEKKEYGNIINQAISAIKYINGDDEDARYAWNDIKNMVKEKSKQYNMIRATIRRQREEWLRLKLAELEKDLYHLEQESVNQ